MCRGACSCEARRGGRGLSVMSCAVPSIPGLDWRCWQSRPGGYVVWTVVTRYDVAGLDELP